MNSPYCILFTAFLILILPVLVSACTCFPVCIGAETSKQCAQKNLKFHGGAVYGRVVEVVQEKGSPLSDQVSFVAKMKVEASWKYRTSEFVNVKFYYNDGANCGTNLVVGQSYLIYAAFSPKGETSVSGCSHGSPDERKFLGKERRPKRAEAR